MHSDKRKTLIGFLTISVALLCEVVNQGHDFKDVTYRVHDAGIDWYAGQCKRCQTVIYRPVPSQELPLVQIANP